MTGPVRVPLVDLEAHHAPLREELDAAFRRVVARGKFVLGPEVSAFEEAAATFLGSKHAIGVSSGTDALLVALAALGVGRGDEVVTTPFTFFATVEVILRLGAVPRFVDVEPGALTLDPGCVEEALSSRTKAILPVHLYGNGADVTRLRALSERHGIPIVEDAAQAFGSAVEGRSLGTFGALGCFSFFPTKVLGALGDGGLVVTNEDALSTKCRRLRDHGRDATGAFDELGGNFRLDELQAAFLSVKLPHVAAWVRKRREHGAAYDRAFRTLGGFQAVERSRGWNGAVYAVRFRAGNRDMVRERLLADGIQTAVYYARPAHLERALGEYGRAQGSFMETERAAGDVLSLPISPEMTVEQRDSVVRAVVAEVETED